MARTKRRVTIAKPREGAMFHAYNGKGYWVNVNGRAKSFHLTKAKAKKVANKLRRKR